MSKKILCLGGGGARGLVNIGALKVIEKEFPIFPFDVIIGSSIGSLIGGCYSVGIPLEKIESISTDFKLRNLMGFKLTNTSVLNQNCLVKVIDKLIGKKSFKDSIVPFYSVTTDIVSEESVIYNTGNLKTLILASCSIPGVFPSVKYDNKLLLDGGLRNNIPTKIAKELGATKILAVDPGHAIGKAVPNNILQTYLKALQITEDELNIYQDTSADVVIRPDLEDITQFNFNRAKYIIECGEQETLKNIKKIKELLK